MKKVLGHKNTGSSLDYSLLQLAEAPAGIPSIQMRPDLPVVGDLDCADIPASKKPVHVTGLDPYNLDGNGDGLGCT